VLRVTDVRQSYTPAPTTNTLGFQPRDFDFDLATGKLKKMFINRHWCVSGRTGQRKDKSIHVPMYKKCSQTNCICYRGVLRLSTV
jgi:hypothetical protein